jgi:hypothetical protein
MRRSDMPHSNAASCGVIHSSSIARTSPIPWILLYYGWPYFIKRHLPICQSFVQKTENKQNELRPPQAAGNWTLSELKSRLGSSGFSAGVEPPAEKSRVQAMFRERGGKRRRNVSG